MYLNEDDIAKAENYYHSHKDSVDRKVAEMEDKTLMIIPTEVYDIIFPMVWKDIHWNWFLNGR